MLNRILIKGLIVSDLGLTSFMTQLTKTSFKEICIYRDTRGKTRFSV